MHEGADLPYGSHLSVDLWGPLPKKLFAQFSFGRPPYTVPVLAPGTYGIRVDGRADSETVELEAVSIRQGELTNVDIRMQFRPER